jgi:hypothetical protein
MKEWTLNIPFKQTRYPLKAIVEYQGSQVIRIRVHGTKSTILLECNYPLLHGGKSKKGIQWKLREGKLDAATPESAQLLMNIFKALEDELKEYYKLLDRQQLGFED